MLSLINHYSKHRTAWALLFATIIGLELAALYFQYILKLAPCTYCIYQRCALLGILAASILGWIKPGQAWIRFIAIIAWIYSAYIGFQLAWTLARMQFPIISGSLEVCPHQPNFPSWLPLNEWIPSIFEAKGPCSLTQWNFLTIEMSQWMIIVFALLGAVGVLILIAQLFPSTTSSKK